jgi:hypothetical protein
MGYIGPYPRKQSGNSGTTGGSVDGALIVNSLFGPVEVGGATGNYSYAQFLFQVVRIP